MFFDSDSGEVRCVKSVEGVLTDFTAPQVLSADGWHQFRIETVGSSIRFYLDGAPIGDFLDATHSRGRVGLAYREQFSTNSNALGGHFDNFEVDVNSAAPVGLAVLGGE
jgi:hypothetical protein